MRTCVIGLGLVLACGGPAFAQQRAVMGVKAGANFANLNFETDGETVDFDRRTGLVGGLFVVVPADARVALQAEVLFSQKGATIEEGGGSGTITLNYLEVPLLARVSTPPSQGATFHVFAGPAFGIRLSANTESRFEGEEESEDIDDEVKRLDVGLAVGAGVEFGRFVVDGRYTWGLVDLDKDTGDDVTSRNRVFSVMAGIRF